MIHDHIQHLKRYAVPHTEAILNFIATHDCAQLPDGEMEIDGRKLFVRIMSYVPKPAVENRFEIHHDYADLQYVASGAEIMQTSRLEDLVALGDYDPTGDFHFFKTSKEVNGFIVRENCFTVFYPHEAHRTTCLWEGYKGLVKKLVFKLRIS
jgi:YhcH/YjgK/YiaL family protein